MKTGYAQSAMMVVAVSLALVAGSAIFQVMGYAPCELCMWQRWLHVSAAVAGLAFLAMRRTWSRPAAWLSIALIAGSGLVGLFHAGIEYGLWEGVSTCSAPVRHGAGDILSEIARAPMVRCDEAAWTLLGISMAGYNFIASLGTAAIASMLIVRKSRTH